MVLGDFDVTLDGFSYLGPGVRILLNNCRTPDNHWVGLIVPDVPGTSAALTLSDGSVLRRSVKGLVGIGSRSGGGHLHFGLGPTRTPASVVIYDPQGAILTTSDTLLMDTYQSLPSLP